MKRNFIIILLITLFSSASVHADFIGPDRSPRYNSVKQILKKPVDSVCITLQGNITEKLRDEYYTFNDGTGSIVVSIKNSKLRDITVTPNDVVEITGKINTGGFFSESLRATILVKSISLKK
ncbi:MAG: NirD/YgiW/YdeI family stress tolerance protein [Alphaproteobacteria bacterium]|nr:NirD/YgiW/YdeI family stress tolerance protein [Alphaproteobacteria bacterium]